jgi:hypothetical protein
VLPGDIPKKPLYIPPTTTRRPTTPFGAEAPVPFKEKQRQFPVLKPDSDTLELFGGCKRSFMAGYSRKRDFTAQVEESNRRTEDKFRAWHYKQEINRLTANTRIRDDEFLRRANKRRLPRREMVGLPTTGARTIGKLPREIQDTTYPRNHVLYHGT